MTTPAQSQPAQPQPTPEQMREAVARYVTEIHRSLGIGTVVYHLVAEPGAGLSEHQATHVGTGLAGGHSAVARDFETIRSRVRARAELVDEMAGAAAAGLTRAHALLAAAIAPGNAELVTLAGRPRPDPDTVRKTLLTIVGGRTQWTPPTPPQPGRKPEPARKPDPAP